MATFDSFSGVVSSIDNFWTNVQQPSGCMKLYAIQAQNGNQVNFVVEPGTFFVNGAVIREGESVTGFYDLNVPVPMIFPPQYRAVVMARNIRNQQVKVDKFNSRLISSDGTLQLNIAKNTRVILTNGQPFTGNLANRNLVVVYSNTTRSIPARTTPHQVIVLC